MKPADERVDSASSGLLPTSHQNGTADGEDEGVSERAASPLSAKSECSAKSRISHGSLNSAGSAQQVDSTPDDGVNEEAEEEETETLRPISVSSAASAKSGVSAKSNKPARSHCSRCSKAATTAPEEAEAAGELENGERAVSALSTRSHLSVKSSKSNIRSSTRASARSPSPKPSDVEKESERATSALSVKSGKSFASVSNKSAKSSKPRSNNCSRTQTPCSQVEVTAEGTDEGAAEEDGARAGSVMSTKSVQSAKSAKSSQSARSACAQASSPDGVSGEVEEARAAEPDDCDEDAHRAASAMSVKSATSGRSSKLLKPNSDGDADAAILTESETNACERAEAEEGDAERAGSAASVKSAPSSRSARSHKATCVIHLTAESPAGVPADDVADRSPSSTSVTSVKSNKSHKSSSMIGSTADQVIADVLTNGVENPSEERLADEDKQPAEQNSLLPVGDDETPGRAGSAVSKCSERSGRSKCTKSKCRKCAKTITTRTKTPDIVNTKTTEGDNEETNNRSASAVSATTESLCNTATVIPSIAVADDQEDQIDQRPASTKTWKSGKGRCNSGLSVLTKSARSPSPSTTPAPPSPAMSVPSKASTRSRCHCGAASRTQKREEGNGRAEDGEEGDATQDKEASERAPSVHSTNQLLSRDSFGSVSLVLPEEEQGDSDGGESRVSAHANPAAAPDAEGTDPSAAEQTADVEDVENPPAPVQGRPDITVDTPGESVHSEKDEERAADTSPTAPSPRSHLSENGGGSKEPERVKSRSSRRAAGSDAAHLEPSASRSTSALSAASGNSARRKPPPPRGSEADRKDGNTLCVTSGTPGRTHSAASTRSGAKAKAATVKRNLGQKDAATSDVGSKTPDVRSVTSASGARSEQEEEEEEEPPRPTAHVTRCGGGGGGLCQSRPGSRQSRGSDTSRSAKRGCQINRRQGEEEEGGGGGELTPGSLPNASPNEVVSDWLRGIPSDASLLVDGEEEMGGGGGGGGEEEEKEGEPLAGEAESPEDPKANEVTETPGEGAEVEEEAEEEEEKAQGEEEAEPDKGEGASDPDGRALPVAEVTSCHHKALFQHSVSMSRNCNSSVAVMKVLLSPSLGRTNSLPEVGHTGQDTDGGTPPER